MFEQNNFLIRSWIVLLFTAIAAKKWYNSDDRISDTEIEVSQPGDSVSFSLYKNLFKFY